jgi:hypothetical protein
VPSGQSREVTITIPVDRLSIRESGRWRFEPGEYEIAVGLRAHDPAAHITRISLP